MTAVYNASKQTALLNTNKLAGFDAVWQTKIKWLDVLYTCHGGRRGVGRVHLLKSADTVIAAFFKKQINHKQKIFLASVRLHSYV